MKTLPLLILTASTLLLAVSAQANGSNRLHQGGAVSADSNRTDTSGSRLRRQRAPRPPRPGVFTSLDSARTMPDSVIILSLRGKGLTSVAGIAAFRNLQLLDLADNALTAFPTEVFKIKGVLTIDLSNNPIKSVPNEIGSLTQMTRLNLRNTSIITLPTTIGDCKSLSSLDVSRNPLASLPIKELNRLPLIKSIIIGGIDADAPQDPQDVEPSDQRQERPNPSR
ncbi:MAG: leucine-rich repeat domain-containing protein [Candidatus Kapabacteria bacterium]|nr:leucine-rich repeat domain-containing protein [Candidatus Kapabacteria bacterium]